MAGNVSPIFSKVGNVQWITGVKTANTTTDLTSGTIYLVYTADATNGGRVEKLIIQPLGTNIATALRVWINNGGSTGTAANNIQIKDLTMAGTTVSQVAAIGSVEVFLDLALDPGFTIYVTVGTTVAAGFCVTGVGGKY